MSSASAVAAPADLVEYCLRLGDDCLVLSHRLSEWTGHAHDFEEDVALANLALDLLGQARNLLSYAGEIEGRGRDEDSLAYWRDDRDFRNCLLVEQPNGDFAMTMVRHLFFSAHQVALHQRLLGSSDATLAAVAGKAVKEARYHRDHAALWVVRLGAGTEESHRRASAAVTALLPLVGELFEEDALVQRLVSNAAIPDPGQISAEWNTYVDATLREATLDRPQVASRSGGRRGLHSEHLGHLLAEMQHLHRSHPDASW